ncbi:hypothetical protein BC834DRAFT_694324 [Gloeopeniophorella convolvens]|nr:hypothetical protein BC834DRAFT_694324 [Gloeopeniophorella convolvens]
MLDHAPRRPLTNASSLFRACALHTPTPCTTPIVPLHRAPLSRSTLPSAVRRTHTPYPHRPRPATSTTCLHPGQAPARMRTLVQMVLRMAPLAACACAHARTAAPGQARAPSYLCPCQARALCGQQRRGGAAGRRRPACAHGVPASTSAIGSPT